LKPEQEEEDMVARVATAYDQNPARIQLVVRRKKTWIQPVWQAVVGIQLLVGLVAAFFWNLLPV
jgi:hypothetical protein